MRQKWLFLFILFLLLSCAPAPADSGQQVNGLVDPGLAETSPAPSPEPDNLPPIDAETRQLAEEFLTLRPIAGQFSGGSWQADVDQWQGRKHTVMIELGTRLGNGRYACSQLTNLLEQPDHIVQGGDSLHDLIQTLPIYDTIASETTQFLVYEWRGTHDFLFFVCEDGRITAADWWYAGE